MSMSVGQSATVSTNSGASIQPKGRLDVQSVGLLETYFYFFMSLLIAVLVIYGFSFTVGKNLIHPAVPRPLVLYVHAVVFSGWVAFFMLQSALIRMRNVRWHRRMGWFGAVMGSSMVILGVSTAITMARFSVIQLHQNDAEFFLIVPFFDMVCFGTALGLAVYCRKKPEYHHRLMLVATCALTAAAFGRLAEFGRFLPPEFFYAGVDLLIVFGVARDLIFTKRVHPVFLYALPGFMLGQTFVMYTYIHRLPYWLKIARAIMG